MFQPPTPKRDRMKPREAKEPDDNRAHRLFCDIVVKNARLSFDQRDRFARALAIQLHHMRLSPSTLLTPEGFDAVSAVAEAVDENTHRHSKIVLSKAWLNALTAVGARLDGFSSTSDLGPSSSFFTNRIRIRGL